MVYESDFYTTRRPYSSSRPYTSSYSVTPILQGPYYLYNPTRVFVRTIPHIPYVGHRKLVSIVHTPVRIYHSGTYLPIKIHSRVRPSIIAAELNRIRYLSRPSSKSYLEDYLQSRDYIDFDDEAKDIRARTDKLLRKVHGYVPRPTFSEYEGETIPERLRSDDYVRRILNAKHARKDIEDLPWYSTPAKRDIGPGHLACIKYAGGRAQPKRRPYYTVSDLVPGDVKTDVKLMSYYSKNRKAAEDALPIYVLRREPARESYNAPAPTTNNRDDEVDYQQETPKQPVQQREEPVVQAKVEPKVEPEIEPEVEAQVAQPEPEPETVQVKIPLKKKKEKKVTIEENNDVDMEAECGEDGVKKVPDEDTIQKVQEYLNKKAAEKKLEEEKRAFEEAERKRIAAEKETARLAALMEEEAKRDAEMREAEKREEERQEIIRKAEEAKAEAERLKEDEKLFNEAVSQAIQDELERVAKEDEEARLRQDEEEEQEDSKIAGVDGSSDIVASEPHSEENSAHAELSDQENEAKPYDVDHDEDTQVEEDEPEEQEVENPFANDEGAAIPAEADEPVPDTPQVKERGCTSDEPGFDWGSIDNEPEVEEACVDRQTPQIEEEAGSEHTAEDVEVSSQQSVEDVQIEEVNEAEETQVEETQITEEAVEETHEEEEVTEIEKTQEAEESDNEEQAQVTEFEEAHSEDKTSHEVSEEEEEEEEE